MPFGLRGNNAILSLLGKNAILGTKRSSMFWAATLALTLSLVSIKTSRNGQQHTQYKHNACTSRHLTAPYGMSNMHTAKGSQSKVYDASMLVAGKPTIYTDIRQCSSVTSTHTSVKSYLLAPRWSLDAVRWHSTQMAIAVSHLYTSLAHMIVPMLTVLSQTLSGSLLMTSTMYTMACCQTWRCQFTGTSTVMTPMCRAK